MRLNWFKDAIDKFLEQVKNEDKINIAIPYEIGCGLAGGDWNDYYKVLSDYCNNNPKISITIYKL